MCGASVDESRSSDTNYMAGVAGGPADWYPCEGCLSILEIEWIPVRSIGDDGWGMSPTGAVRLPGAVVSHAMERLRATLAEGDAALAWAELTAHPNTTWLVQTPEVVATAVAGLRGSAVAARDLQLALCSRSDYANAKRTLNGWFVSRYVHLAELDDATSDDAAALMRNGTGEVLIPGAGPLHTHAVLRRTTKLRVHGSRGPFALVTPATPLYEDNGDAPLRVTLDRIAPDPEAP